MYVAASQLALSFALPSPNPPPLPYRRLSYVVFVVGTIEDCIRGSKMLLAYSRRSDRGEHAVLHYPNAAWRLTKKDRGRFLLLI